MRLLSPLALLFLSVPALGAEFVSCDDYAFEESIEVLDLFASVELAEPDATGDLVLRAETHTGKRYGKILSAAIADTGEDELVIVLLDAGGCTIHVDVPR